MWSIFGLPRETSAQSTQWIFSCSSRTSAASSGHPFRSAYIRRVMLVHAPRAAASSSYGLGPALVPPTEIGSSAIRGWPLARISVRKPLAPVLATTRLSPGDAALTSSWKSGMYLSQRPRNVPYGLVGLRTRKTVSEDRVGDGDVIHRSVENRRKRLASSVIEDGLDGVHRFNYEL